MLGVAVLVSPYFFAHLVHAHKIINIFLLNTIIDKSLKNYKISIYYKNNS